MAHTDFGDLKDAVHAARRSDRTQRLLQVILAGGLSALTVVAVAGVLLTELL
jgi:hypothetical protein